MHGKYLSLSHGRVHAEKRLARCRGDRGRGLLPGSQRGGSAASTLRSHGLDASDHVATLIGADELGAVDLVLAMDTDHFEDLVPALTEIDPSERPMLRMFRSFDPVAASEPHDRQGVYDPWYGDAGDFRETWKLVSAALPALVDYVRSNIASRGNR